METHTMTVEELIAEIKARSMQGEAEIMRFLAGVTPQMRSLKGAEWTLIKAALKEVHCSGSTFTDFKKNVREDILSRMTESVELAYIERDGGMIFVDPQSYNENPVAEFTAKIKTWLSTEDGDAEYSVEGITKKGIPFSFDMPVPTFMDERALAAKIASIAGPSASVHTRMKGHLPTAIQMITGDDYETINLIKRTGWNADKSKFSIQGREPEDTIIRLTNETNFNLGEADLEKGLAAFTALIKSLGHKQTLPAIAGLFVPQLAPFVKISNRFTTFIVGRTNSLKSTWCKTAIRIWNKEFDQDTNVFMWKGITERGVLISGAKAMNMPMLIDNYKPDQGMGAKGLLGLIHAFNEGGGKVVGLRSGTESGGGGKMNTWMLCNGEDFPGTDESSVTRTNLIVLPNRKDRSRVHELDSAADNAEHLCVIGSLWLDFLESESGQERIAELAKSLREWSSHWAQQVIAYAGGKQVAERRIADNMALIQLTLTLLREVDDIGNAMEDITDDDVSQAIMQVIVNLVDHAAEANEGERWVAEVRALLDGSTAILANGMTDIDDLEIFDRDRVIGWIQDDYVEILPKKTMVLLTRNNAYFNKISKDGLYKRLNEMGVLIQPKPVRSSVPKGEKKSRPSILRVKREVLL